MTTQQNDIDKFTAKKCAAPVFPEAIGSPLTPSALKVMILGAGELGKEVIIEFQRLGIEVCAVDRYPNAPGHQVAHKSFVIDMTDEYALSELIKQQKPHWVVPEIEAIATTALRALEAAGTIQVIPNASAAWLTMNREGIRRLAAIELKLPCSRFEFASDFNTLREAIENGLPGSKPIGYPCIVKPIMSSSGKGQSRVNQADELLSAWKHAEVAGRVDSGRVIVEQVIDFDYEITLLTVRSRDQDQVKTSFCEPIGHLQRNGDYVESWQPHPMSPIALENAQQIAQKVTEELGGVGLFGVELFVKGDDVWFSEVSPRPHDTGMVTTASQWQTEFELHVRAILGLPVDTRLKSPAASAVVYGQLEAKGIAFEGLAKALAVEGSTVRLFGKPESFPLRRMGVALAHATTIEKARERAKQAASLVQPVAPST